MTHHAESASHTGVQETIRTAEIAASLTDGLSPSMDEHGQSPHVHCPPGAVVAIIEGETQLISVNGAAHHSRAADSSSRPVTVEAMTDKHVHDLASVSKIFTTLTLQRLFSEGAAAPSDILKDFFGEAAGAHQGVTLENLLRHRSGMRPWWPLYLASGDPLTTILRLEPMYAQGRECKYSDLGMQVLGEVISIITAQPFEEAVRTLLLNPLQVDSVTAARPYQNAPIVSGGHGDAIERDMIANNTPYPVSQEMKAAASDFPWRDHLIRGQVGDGNAFHAYGGVAGHAGWFGDATGLLRIASALAEPQRAGISPQKAEGLRQSSAQKAGSNGHRQGEGSRVYSVPWRGEKRTFLGHPGFTGTFIAAAPATPRAPQVQAVILTNRLHGAPPPGRTQLANVDRLWKRAMSAADQLLHSSGPGE